MSLPEHEWLHVAKRLAIGAKTRVRHRSEHRLNLIIGNEHDRYWAYCQRCHEGGVVQKDHVRLTGSIPNGSDVPVLPTDLVSISGSDWELPVARFLATKGMDLQYLQCDAQVSPSRKRLVLHGKHGRDLTGRAMSKWMVYDDIQVQPVRERKYATCVITEDLFSAHKVAWCSEKFGLSADVVCALGTDIRSALVLHLMRYAHLVWFFDNDNAGVVGSAAGVNRTHVFVPRQDVVLPPAGKDPKDMRCEHIVDKLKGVGL